MSNIEEKLIQMLSEALEVDATKVTPDTGFAELGLDSIAGLRFARKAQNAVGIHIELEWLFDYPSVAELASYIETRGDGANERPAT